MLRALALPSLTSTGLLPASSAALCCALSRLLSSAAPKPNPASLPAFHYAVLRAPLMKDKEDGLPRHLRPLAEQLDRLGGTGVIGPGPQVLQAARAAGQQGQPLALLVGTGGTEADVLQMTQAYHQAYRQASAAAAHAQQLESSGLPPLLLLAHPYANSLPSSLEALARLHQDGMKGSIVYLGEDSSSSSASSSGGRSGGSSGSGVQGLKALQTALRNVGVWHQLHRCRMGVVGTPSPWLVASSPSAVAVRTSWGPSLVDVDMRELMGRLQEEGGFPDGQVQEVVRDIVGGSTRSSKNNNASSGSGSGSIKEQGCFSCSCAFAVEAAPAARVYLAMRGMVDALGLSCITVRCFDVVTEKATTGCYSLARLLDEGVIAGCEGDVCSALGMLWGQLMTGQVPWMANLAQVDEADGCLTLAHCTIARSLLSSHQTDTHFESGLGVAIRGTVPPGSVTLLRIGGKQLERVWVEEGYVLREGAQGGASWSPNLCRTQVRVSMLGGRGVVQQLLEQPLGNHVVLLRGHQKAALEAYFRQFGPGTQL